MPRFEITRHKFQLHNHKGEAFENLSSLCEVLYVGSATADVPHWPQAGV